MLLYFVRDVQTWIRFIGKPENYRFIRDYIYSEDFETVCDLGGHEVQLVQAKIEAMLTGEIALDLNDYKYTLRKKRKKKGDAPRD